MCPAERAEEMRKPAELGPIGSKSTEDCHHQQEMSAWDFFFASNENIYIIRLNTEETKTLSRDILHTLWLPCPKIIIHRKSVEFKLKSHILLTT